ncbi:MAG: chromate efflux transporter [Leucobacter sp.]
MSGERGRALEVFRVFLRLGLTSFGGPVAHLGYFREELVIRRRWVSERQYAELVALCQFLPGPASSQLGFALGLLRGGYPGAVVAWLAFTMPSALLLILFARGVVALDNPAGQGLLAGLQAVAIAVVAHAVWGMGRTLTPDPPRIMIGLVSGTLALLLPGGPGQLAAILLGLLLGTLLRRGDEHFQGAPLDLRVSRRSGIAALALLLLLVIALPIAAGQLHSSWISIADAFTRAGALVFGGGHVVLPLLQAEPAIAETVDPELFLAGYGAAQAVPGPLFAFAAYLGAEMQPGAAGVGAGLLALLAIFLPGILLLLAALPFWNALRTRPAVRAAVSGASAAVVGILAAALIHPLSTSGLAGPASLLIALVCLSMILVRLPVWTAVLCGAGLGAIAGWLDLGLSWG